MPATRITVHHVVPELADQHREIGAKRVESPNTTAPRRLEDAVEPETRRERLGRYADWTREELEEFEAAVRAQRVVDEQYWR